MRDTVTYLKGQGKRVFVEHKEKGQQTAKLLFLSSEPDQPIADFAMNTNCAAGTGSFLALPAGAFMPKPAASSAFEERVEGIPKPIPEKVKRQ